MALPPRPGDVRGRRRRDITLSLVISCTRPRFGVSAALLPGPNVPYVLVAVFAVPVWLAVLALAGCYDQHRQPARSTQGSRRGPLPSKRSPFTTPTGPEPAVGMMITAPGGSLSIAP